MEAFILASDSPSASADLARPVAGAPLLVRQLEWLRVSGVTHATVNRVAHGGLPKALGADAIAQSGVEVTWVPSARPLSREELALRTGRRTGVVAEVRHALLGSVPLDEAFALAQRDGVDVRVRAGELSVEVWHRGGGGTRPVRAIDGEGWLVDGASEQRVHALVEQLLSGARGGIEVRGSELAPGVFRARGAIVAAGAELVGPCYLGAHCVVADGARVGPGAVIGERAIVERGAAVEHARVGDGVVVGQGVRIERACAERGRIERHSGRVVDLDDPLLLGDRDGREVASRLLAAAAIGAVAPCAVILDRKRVSALARRLARIVDGRGAWLGVRDDLDPDGVVVNVLPYLVPPDALDEERDAAHAFYRARKSLWLDAKLAVAMALGQHSF